MQYFPSWPQLLPNPSAAAFAQKLDFHSFVQFLLQVNGSPKNWTKIYYILYSTSWVNNIKVSVFTDCAQLYQRINMFLQENNKPISLWADWHIVSHKGFKTWKMKINKYWFISFSCKRMPLMLLGNFYKSEELTDASWALDTRVSYVGGKLKDFSTCSFKFSSAKKRNNTYSITVTRDQNKKKALFL